MVTLDEGNIQKGQKNGSNNYYNFIIMNSTEIPPHLRNREMLTIFLKLLLSLFLKCTLEIFIINVGAAVKVTEQAKQIPCILFCLFCIYPQSFTVITAVQEMRWDHTEQEGKSEVFPS